MKEQRRWLLVATLVLAFALPVRAQAQEPVVRAVLFYSPTCGHCHYVITEVLPPLGERYGDQLQIMGVSTASPGGQSLFQAAIETYNVSEDRRGVPFLVIDSTVLVGSLEIPEQFPALVERYLAAGGVDWPDIPGLTEALAANEATPTATATVAPSPTVVTTAEAESAFAQPAPTPTQTASNGSPLQPAIAFSSGSWADSFEKPTAGSLGEKLSRDPAGNFLAILLLVAMVTVLAFAVVLAIRFRPGQAAVRLAARSGRWLDWAVAALCGVGLGVSLYMAFVETTHTAAVCGPVGDCNTVQQSEYAFLFGLLPVGVLGVFGYAAMLVAWAARRWGCGKLQRLADVALFAMALFGTLFSIYLTFLEPFVIGATCMWCLTSALCMTLILLILAGSMPARPRLVRQSA